MEIRFDQKTVLITGASSGIGRASAIMFGKAGANVAVHYNESSEDAAEVAANILKAGGRAITVRADITVKEEILSMTELVIREFGSIHVLVNNAGALIKRVNIEEMDEGLWDQVMNINLKSTYLVTQAVIPQMKRQHDGKIINVTSIAARMGGGVGAAHYSAAKGGVLTLTKNMARELSPFGIYVNAVAPGIIDTRFHERYTKPEVFNRFIESVVLKRAGKAEEVASVILFLASEHASYILGETIEVNGGQLMD